VTANIE